MNGARKKVASQETTLPKIHQEEEKNQTFLAKNYLINPILL
jgi:hypothetical protein